MGLLRRILGACGRAAGRVARGSASSASTEVPSRVRQLLRDIEHGEFSDVNYSEMRISHCRIKLPANRSIFARWHSTGERRELRMRKGKGDYVELPHNQWSEMILKAIITKTRNDQNQKLEELLNV